jgi:hypothetical protein
VRNELSLVLAAAAVVGPGSAIAAEPAASSISLVERDCSLLDERALGELVELELRTLSATGSRVRVEIVCNGHVAAVSLADADGRPYPIASRVDFSKAGPGARERLVALAATELVAQAERAERAKPVTGESSKAAGAPPTRDAAPARTAGPEPPERPLVEVELTAVGTALGSPTTLLVGVALGANVALGGPWVAAFDARFDRGASDIALAEVSWTMLGGSAALEFERRLGIARLGVGAGVRGGRLSLDARAEAPDSGRNVSGAWFGPMVPVRAAFDLVDRVALVAKLEGGYVAIPVRGTVDGGNPVVRAEGPWASLGFGVSAAF